MICIVIALVLIAYLSSRKGSSKDELTTDEMIFMDAIFEDLED